MSKPDAYSSLAQWLDYWNGIHVSAIDLGLERIRPVAEYLQVLHPAAHVVTVAGTNGKGSTTTTIAAIYHAAGFSVGLYQSPHIYRFNERIRLGGRMVDDQTLIVAFVAVEQARVACNLSLSFFEATTLAAFLIFKQQACDIWVLEVGLGGRLDAVNLIDPNVAVITNIGLDHVEWLGDSIEQIAYEKAGILRPGIPVVFAGDGTALQVPQPIITQAAKLDCPLIIGKQDYDYQRDSHSLYYSSASTTLALPAPALAEVNVAAAISAVLWHPAGIGRQAIATGVASARLAGRFEIRQFKQRMIILDVAHNVHGVNFLLQQLRTWRQHYPQAGSIHLVFSMLADKDIAGVAGTLHQALAGQLAGWYLAPLPGPRAASLTQLQQGVEPASLTATPIRPHATVALAFEAAMGHSQPQDVILVCGSFHTLEAVWELLTACQ